MAEKPANQKLWNTIVVLARAKFHPYPSPAASHWVHKNYVDKGGQFVESGKDDKRSQTGRRR